MQQYLTFAWYFGRWCKEHHGVRHREDCIPYVQDYIDYLISSGKTADTIHNYLYGICFVFELPFEQYRKPIRYAANTTRSRGKKKSDRKPSETDSKYNALAESNRVRVSELARLRGCDGTYDESGCFCAHVRKGKGGKNQKQRIAPKDLPTVRPYFDGSSQYIFAKEEVARARKFDTHHLRHCGAQRDYISYYEALMADPAYRQQLTEEVRRRCEALSGNRWEPKDVQGTIYLRSKNRDFAKKHQLPIAYDRLAVMAVSVFSLSHWRTNVTISHYLLAYAPDESYPLHDWYVKKLEDASRTDVRNETERESPNATFEDECLKKIRLLKAFQEFANDAQN